MKTVLLLMVCVMQKVEGGNPASQNYVQENGGGGSSSPSPKYQIGQYAEGGVVFWLDASGQHGLVCSIEDMNSSVAMKWSVNYASDLTNSVADGVVFGLDNNANITTLGKINTALIVAQNGVYNSSSNAYAAGACAAYAYGGYTDWYLPCLAELRLIEARRQVIYTTSQAYGGAGLRSNDYWSSSESFYNAAWGLSLSAGNQLNYTKGVTCFVRAVRAF